MPRPSQTARLRPAKPFGERVRRERQRVGMSQEQLADASGFHPTYLSDVERGSRNVTLYTIVRIADSLGVNPAALVDGLTP